MSGPGAKKKNVQSQKPAPASGAQPVLPTVVAQPAGNQADLHKPLDVGEARVYKDMGGNVGMATRPSSDVIVICVVLRAGQTTPRGDYQTEALPVAEAAPFLIGPGGFERLHAIGPLIGHESPYGILWGPYDLNRHLQEHGIETYIAHLRELLPSNAALHLTVHVERELGAGKYMGYEFLKSISYSIDVQRDGEVERTPIFRSEILVERPQDPKSMVNFGESRMLVEDPLKRAMDPQGNAKGVATRQRRVADLSEREKHEAEELIDRATQLTRELRRSKKNGAKQVGKYLNELITRQMKSSDKMTRDDLSNLRDETEEVLQHFPELDPRRNMKQPPASISLSGKAAPAEAGSILQKSKSAKPVETSVSPGASTPKPADASTASAPISSTSEPVPQPPPVEPSTLQEPSAKGGGAPLENVPLPMSRPTFPVQAPVYSGKAEKEVIAPFEPYKDKFSLNPVGPSNGGELMGGAGMLLIEVEMALQHEAVVRDARLSSSLRTLRWWLQRGVVPPAKGVTDRWFSNAERTDNIDEIARGVKEGRFQGIEVGKLNQPQQYEAFEEWVTANIHSMEDLYLHFVHHLDSGVQWDLENNQWELVTWEWGELGFNNVSETRVQDDRISKFMDGILAQVMTQTKNSIQQVGNNRSPVAQDAQVKIAGKRSFRVDGRNDRSLYDPYTMVRLMFRTQWNRPPLFYEIVAEGVPDDYVLVTGADTYTYFNIHHFRSLYGSVASEETTIGAPPKYDKTNPNTGWHGINIPVALVKKEALINDGG